MSAAIRLHPTTLREKRTRLDLSVRSLSRLSGVSTRTIRRIEEGCRPVTRNVLRRLERALQRDDLSLASARVGAARGSREELRDVVPWELDPCAQLAVQRHPEGLSVAQVAELMDLDWRTVEVIEAVALAKLRLVSKHLEEHLHKDWEIDTSAYWRAIVDV